MDACGEDKWNHEQFTSENLLSQYENHSDWKQEILLCGLVNNIL